MQKYFTLVFTGKKNYVLSLYNVEVCTSENQKVKYV